MPERPEKLAQRAARHREHVPRGNADAGDPLPGANRSYGRKLGSDENSDLS